MSRAIVWAALALVYSLFASAAHAQERCLAGRYDLPASIGEEMRPYLICGLIQGDPHFGKSLNGQRVSMRGNGLAACGNIRSQALEASDRRLAPIMRDAAARRSFLKAEFESADRFLRVAASSQDLSVGQEASAPQCRDQDAQD